MLEDDMEINKYIAIPEAIVVNIPPITAKRSTSSWGK